ncbi:MAG: NAD-dependent epimerase [Magnetococcales bacterium]|nr:NAD-dependent epimerase [Magnetococcales bacterium]
MRILVTGAAGFIGFHLSKALLERGDTVVGIDNLNDYYDVQIKKDRLAILEAFDQFEFKLMDMADRPAMEELFKKGRFKRVVNLAAQAGVRYSIENPHAYVDSNVVGFVNLLEGCRHTGVQHLVFASSSSIYGASTKVPYSVADRVDHPVSIYAASKKSNELMAHSYAHLFDLAVTGIRYFTVYGPWGRPDMAFFKFTNKILKDEPIDVYNYGRHRRDFTYIDDVIEGTVRVLDRVACGDTEWSSDDPNPQSSYAPYRIYNLGNNSTVELMDYIKTLEELLGKEAKKNMRPLQPGDVIETYADVESLVNEIGFQPKTTTREGLSRFVDWYRDYYDMKA